MHSLRRFSIALLAVVIGIAVPMTVKPSGVVLAVLWSLIGVALLATVLTWDPVTRRLPFEVRRRRHDDDPALPVRDDRRDLADNLNAYASRVADWLDAREVQAPRIIDENTAAILGTGTLAEMLRIAKDDPERWEAQQQATAHYERITRTEYMLGWRAEALALFDQAVQMGVISPQIRKRLEKPDMTQLQGVPEVLRTLAARLRVQAADKLLNQYTVGHFPSPMRPHK